MEEFLVILTYICPILVRILIPLSINLDCRARNLAQRKGFTILAVFFPIIVGLIYAFKRKSMQKAFKICSKCGSKADAYAKQCPKCGGYLLLEYKNPKEKTLKIISIVLCIVGVVAYVVGEAVGLPNQIKEMQSEVEEYIDGETEDAFDEIEGLVSGNTLYYDRNGEAYSNYFDVKYYDREGNEYSMNGSYEDGRFYDLNGKSYEFENSYVDKDGYFCYITDKTKFHLSDGTFTDKDGNEYYSAAGVLWDYSGRIINDEN